MATRNYAGQARDNQRSRLYAAENVLRGLRVSKAATKHLIDTQAVAGWSVIVDGRARPMRTPTIGGVQDYVDAVTSASWFQARWGQRGIIVVAGKGSHSNGYRQITVSQQHRRSESVILHEIAHCLVGLPHAWHGPEFAGVLLTLVRYQMGKEHADTLRASFKEKGARYNLKAVPSPSRPVVTQAERSKRATAAKRQEKARLEEQRAASHRRLTGYTSRQSAAATVRALIKDGHFGPSGSAGRKAALATARSLEGK